MIPVLLRAGARYHLHHRLQLVLAVLGVSLGVAVVVAVDVATGSARRAFDLSTSIISGNASHEILGGPDGIADSVFVRLRTTLPADIALAPVIDRYVSLETHDGRVLRLLGVDPLSEQPFRNFLASGTTTGSDAPTSSDAAPTTVGTVDVGALVTQRALVLPRRTAADLNLSVGDSVFVTFAATTTPAIVSGIFEPGDDAAGAAADDLVLTDIATAQELTGAIGVIDRIDVRSASGLLDTGADAGIDALRAALPGGLRLLESEARAGATARLTRAFDTNLTALALVALVFGMFLIYNSVSFSVVQRRPLFGLLRAQGVTTRELGAQILVEAGVLGVVATLIGIAGGSALGALLLRLVSRTINDLYFTVAVDAAGLDVSTLVKAATLGLCATVAAAIPPAVEALRTPPRSTLARAVLERRAARNAPRLAVAGLAAAIVAALLLGVPSRSITLGFSGLFTLILAAALVTPAATALLMRALRPIAAWFGAVGRMATGGVTASLSRTAPAIAALAVALSVGIAVTLMISSFRDGVVRWLDQSLQADIYIAAPGTGADRSGVALDDGLPAALATVPGVAGISTYRDVSLLLADPVRTSAPDPVRSPTPDPVRGPTPDPVRSPTPDPVRGATPDPVRGPTPDPVRNPVRTAEPDLVRMLALDLFADHRAAFEMLDASDAEAWRAFDDGAVLISEPLSYRRGIGAGDTILLPTDRGVVPFAVAAVYRDYASEHGVIFMQRATYEAWWRDRSVTSIAVFLDEDADADVALTAIRELPSARGIVARQNRGLRDATLQVFDRTFLITGVLRLLALLVAFVGVTGALMALQLERARDVGVLRTLGLTPLQVWSLITSQTALMGLAAATLAMPLGLAMSWAMVHVINRRSFGWSFDLVLMGAPFLQALAIGVTAAVLAGLYPALRMARLRPANVMRSE